MERMLVAIFDDKARARKASDALERLGDDGEISVHAIQILTRGNGGGITADTTYDALPEGTMGGTAVGALIGLIGGPVGLAIGAASGMLIGATADYAKNRVTSDFAQHVADELTPGRTAVVADVYEESTEPVDGELQPLGATIFRRDLQDVTDTEYAHEADAIKEELAHAREKSDATREDLEARLRARTEPVIEKLEEKLTRD